MGLRTRTFKREDKKAVLLKINWVWEGKERVIEEFWLRPSTFGLEIKSEEGLELFCLGLQAHCHKILGDITEEKRFILMASEVKKKLQAGSLKPPELPKREKKLRVEDLIKTLKEKLLNGEITETEFIEVLNSILGD